MSYFKIINVMDADVLTWRKNPHTPYMVSKNLSACEWQNLTSINLRTCKIVHLYLIKISPEKSLNRSLQYGYGNICFNYNARWAKLKYSLTKLELNKRAKVEKLDFYMQWFCLNFLSESHFHFLDTNWFITWIIKRLFSLCFFVFVGTKTWFTIDYCTQY